MARNLKAQGLGLALAAMLLVGASFLQSATASAANGNSGSGSGVALAAPAIPGVAPLPGPIADPASVSPNMGLLKVTPQQAVAGTPMTISGSNLAANQNVELTWSSANVTWVLDPEPGTVNYMGRSATPITVVLKTTPTDANGAFSVTLKAPDDFGGVHDIYAVINGVDVAHGGFILRRQLIVSPRSGPIGTPITVTYSGLGSSLYEGGASLLYDNHYVGEMMANWTRGTAQAVIRASGPVGRHTIQVGDAITFLYMNVPQSPLPFMNGGAATFTVTKDDGRPKSAIDWPVGVTPTVSARTTLTNSGLAASTGVTANLGPSRGSVFSQVSLTASGLSSTAPVQLSWSTVVGSRVNCTSTCWVFVSTPLGTATPSGGSLQAKVKIPDGLGGWHVVQLTQNGHVVAQVPFYVEESVVGRGVNHLVVREGQPFTIHLKGVGWTQLDNVVGVDYDNSYVGYACGINSNGDVLLHMRATGGPGTHLIDLYPMLYSLSPS
ncbi:MAG: hypothetical protein WB770_05060, partial [Acidimicrobiales bacterium]